MEIDEPQQQQQQRRRIVPWVEKYRPEAVDDIAHQEEVVKTLKSSIESGSLPHLLFHGPPGTGKTTTILAVARALYGPELFRARILELNASDERGIAVIREKVKTFAQGAVGGQKTPGYPCPRFKLIILDEADTMTSDAQSALRRVMETYSKVTRFCLICNYVTRIIEPLASRCAKFRFKPLPVDSMVARLRHIAQSENVDLSQASLDTIMEISQGDMRKAVTFIQSSHQLSAGAVITPDLIYEISGQVPPNVMQKLWASICSGSIDRMLTEVSDIIAEGYPVSAILAKLQSMTLEGNTAEGMASISNINKALICEKIAQVEKCLLNGSSEALQLRDLGAFVMRRLSGGSTQSEATLVA